MQPPYPPPPPPPPPGYVPPAYPPFAPPPGYAQQPAGYPPSRYPHGYVPPPIPTNSLIRLRPLEISDLFDETIRIYRRNFPVFAGISVALIIPSLLLQYFEGAFAQAGQFFSLYSAILQGKEVSQIAQPDVNWIGLVITLVILLLIVPVNAGAIVCATNQLAEGSKPTWGSVFRAVFQRYFSLAGLSLVGLITAPLFCLTPLWVWIWIGWCVATPALFAERRGFVESLGRSWNLVEGRWWRTFLLVLLIGLLVWVVDSALGAFAQVAILLGAVLPQVIAGLVVYTLQDLVAALVGPLVPIALVLIYYDLRVRREGLDLMQQAESLIRPPSTAPGPLPS